MSILKLLFFIKILRLIKKKNYYQLKDPMETDCSGAKLKIQNEYQFIDLLSNSQIQQLFEALLIYFSPFFYGYTGSF